MVVSKLMAGVFKNETSLVETGRLLHLLTYHAKKVRYQNLLIRYQAKNVRYQNLLIRYQANKFRYQYYLT